MRKISRKTKRRKVLNNKIDRILVPLDGSKNSFRALREAISLTSKIKSKITGIYVIPMDVSSLPLTKLFEPLSAITPIGYKEQKIKEAKAIMQLAKEKCKQKKIGFSSKIIEGNPGDKIIKYSRKRNEKFDWIIMGSRGMTYPEEIFLGSVSHYVVHKSKIPVLVVK